MYYYKFVILLFLLSSCASVAELKSSLSEKALKAGFESKITQTSNFKIFSLEKITNPAKPLRVYIEGDGNAWLSKTNISPNPTPIRPMLAKLAFADDSENIIYIARPCQYVEDPKCVEKYWTSAIYSHEAINSVDEVLDEYQDYQIELIGYSGGATIALFIAANRENIKSLHTIAGNIDTEAFVKLHDVSPYSDSRSTDEVIPSLANIPQHHLIGAEDDIVPQKIADSYVSKLPHLRCTKLSIIPNADHVSGWDGKAPRLLNQKIKCAKSSSKTPLSKPE